MEHGEESDDEKASRHFDRTIRVSQLSNAELLRSYDSIAKATDFVATDLLQLLEAEVKRRGLRSQH